MRSAALLLSLCCAAGVAQAAPASDTDVAAVVKTLGMGSLGATMTSLVIDSTPVLKALPDAEQTCAQAPVRDLLDAQFRRHRPSLGGGFGRVPPRADEVCLPLKGRRRHDVEVAGHRDGLALNLYRLRPRNHLERLGKAHATSYQ